MSNLLRSIWISSSILIWSISVCYATDINQIRLLKENYKQIVLSATHINDSLQQDLIRIEPETELSDQMVIELQQRYPFDLDNIAAYLSTLTDDGTWPDINYQDTKRSGWDPKRHADRILELSKLYYSASTSYFQSDKVMSSIHRALHYWFTAHPKCLNWWYNQIGIPKTLGTAFILLEDQLSDNEKRAAIRVMQASEIGMTGQNKVWLAGNVLIRGLLEKNEALVKEARDTIAAEIVLGREEGIKSDWSFHQHGPQLQFGNYGLAFISGMSFYDRLFRNTAFEFDPQQIDILTSLIEKGYRWIIWNRHMDINALGRQLFHNAQLHKAYGLAFAAKDLDLKEGFPKTANTLTGHKYFYDSDYAIHRRQNWMASVRMSSNRVIGTELVNEDNLKGYYMGDGATYYYIQGDEYLNIFPFWDWRKIPGVTAYEDNAPLPNINRTKSNNRSNMVGGLSNGTWGMVAMELNRDRLKAYKTWLLLDDFVVCIGTGITTDSLSMVTTSIEQCLKKGNLSRWNGKKWTVVNGTEKFYDTELRFHHNNIGYIIISGDTCVAETQKRTGQWHDFMKMYQPTTVEGEITSLHLRHGVKPQHGNYSYIVLPNKDQSYVSSFNTKSIKLLQNNNKAQIIALPRSKCYWAAVYSPDSITIEGVKIVIDAPGIYYLTRTNEGLTINLKQLFPCGKD